MRLPIELIHYICTFDLSLLHVFYQQYSHFPLPRSFAFLVRLVSDVNGISLFQKLFQQMEPVCNPVDKLCLLDEALAYNNGPVMDTLLTCWKFPEDIMYAHVEYGIQEKCDTVVFVIFKHYPSLAHSDTLVVAVQAERMEWVRFILNHPQYEELDTENRAFLLTIENDAPEIFQFMLQHPNVDPHEPDNAPFKEALYSGKIWMIRRMMENPYILRTIQLDSDDRRLYTELMY